jgi:hypothetical protein
MLRRIHKQCILLTITLLLGCQVQKSDQVKEMRGSTLAQVGGDHDEHACIASAGYTWSTVKNNCVRLFEEGTRLSPAVKNSSAELSAFVIFSEDESEVEVFLPELSTSLLMLRSGEKVDLCWEKEGLRLFQKKNLVLMKGDRVIFTE